VITLHDPRQWQLLRRNVKLHAGRRRGSLVRCRRTGIYWLRIDGQCRSIDQSWARAVLRSKPGRISLVGHF
jgi:hypothetical protein